MASNQKGFTIISVLIVGTIVIVILMGIGRLFTARGRMQTSLVRKGDAAKSCAGYLYSLMDLPWWSGQLIEGDHTEGEFTWTVTPIGASMTRATRLIEIVVRDNRLGVAQGIKYNDF